MFSILCSMCVCLRMEYRLAYGSSSKIIVCKICLALALILKETGGKCLTSYRCIIRYIHIVLPLLGVISKLLEIV